MGEELFNAYESFMFINGKMAPLKTFAKRFNSFEEMFFFYSSQIGHRWCPYIVICILKPF